MNNLKMKDLLVSIRPKDSRYLQGNLLTESHLMDFPKCTQPSKALPFAAAPGAPTKQTTEENALAPADPCPCPSKTVEEEPPAARNPLQGLNHRPQVGRSQEQALADLKTDLSALQASTADLY